jgi:thioesterase domain-containing protein
MARPRLRRQTHHASVRHLRLSRGACRTAARYVEAITTAQPSGPHEVIGYSTGGLIAFEVSRQHGREVVDTLKSWL